MVQSCAWSSPGLGPVQFAQAVAVHGTHIVSMPGCYTADAPTDVDAKYCMHVYVLYIVPCACSSCTPRPPCRSYYAMRRLNNEQGLKTTHGIPTNVAAQMPNYILQALQQTGARRVAVAFDRGPTWRHALSLCSPDEYRGMHGLLLAGVDLHTVCAVLLCCDGGVQLLPCQTSSAIVYEAPC